MNKTKQIQYVVYTNEMVREGNKIKFVIDVITDAPTTRYQAVKLRDRLKQQGLPVFMGSAEQLKRKIESGSYRLAD